MRSAKEKERVIRLRTRDGMSISEIHKQTEIPNQTIRRWIKSYPLTHEQDLALAKRNPNYKCKNGSKIYSDNAKDRRAKMQKEGRNIAADICVSDRDKLWISGAMLYWGEGGKTVRTTLDFTNSDPDMIRHFCLFLTQALEIAKEEIRVQIHCYDDADVRKCEKYWLQQCGLSEDNLTKTIVLSSKSSKRNLKYGTCKLRVYDVDAAQSVFGFIKEMAGIKDDTLWL